MSDSGSPSDLPGPNRFEKTDFRSGLAEFVGPIIAELIFCRLRERALLETLRTGPFEWSRYEALFEEIRNRDADAMTQQLLLTDEAFERHFADWIKGEIERNAERTAGPPK